MRRFHSNIWMILTLVSGYLTMFKSADETIPNKLDSRHFWTQKHSSQLDSYPVSHQIKSQSSNQKDSRGRLYGRHVCSKNKVRMLPVTDLQSYCKPGYQSYLRRCDKHSSRYCSGYRIVYELAYRSVQRFVARTESLPFCCPGWTQARVTAHDCRRAVCKDECANNGTCLKPGLCQCTDGWSGRTCSIDIDECVKETHGCVQICINTPGSYRCSCDEGFTLSTDGRNCEKNAASNTNIQGNSEMLKNIELLQQRLETLETWKSVISREAEDRQEVDRINSLSEQIAILEERLDECSCYKREEISFPKTSK